MSQLLLRKNNIEYILHEYDNEKELEEIVREHYEKIFGEQILFFDKQEIQTRAEIKAKTDGFILSLNEKKWYILEVELSRHDIYSHIVPQITKFRRAHDSYNTRRKIVEAFYDEIENSSEKKKLFRLSKIEDIHKFLTETIDSKPTVVIIIDDKTEEIREVLESLPFESRVIEFKTFTRKDINDLSDHIHLFEPFIKPKVSEVIIGEITPQREYRIPILEALIELGGRGRMKEVLEKVERKIGDKLTTKDREMLSGSTSVRWKNAAQWEREKMKEGGLLRTDSPRGVWEITKKGESYYRNSLQLKSSFKRERKKSVKSGWQRLKEDYPTVEAAEKKIKEAREKGYSQGYIKVLENLKKYWEKHK